MNTHSASPKSAFLLLWLVMTASCSGKDVGSTQTPVSGDSGTPKVDGGGARTGPGGNNQSTGGRSAGGAQGGGAGSHGGGGAQGTGGSAGSGVCTVDSDCPPATCGKCPDGSTVCPTTRCATWLSPGYCVSTPVDCPACTVDEDCPLPACTVCIDGSTACSARKCLSGACGGQTISICASQSGPGCTSDSQCPTPVCRACPDGSQVCTDTGCTDGRCHANSMPCPQCKADGDCGKPFCSVCYDGTTACGTATCQQGQCVNTPPKCPERPTGRPLQWHWTCGYPVCPLPGPDAGGRDASVSCAAEGTPCTERGAACGNPASNCGATMVCEDYDPKQGGCPISSAKFKNDIRYLEPGDLERLRDETLKFRLTNYRYKPEFTSDPNAEHLGFIIEDNPQSPAVDQGHDRVDLYGYVSMVVATLQVQQKEIQSLRKQLRALQAKRASETKR